MCSPQDAFFFVQAHDSKDHPADFDFSLWRQKKRMMVTYSSEVTLPWLPALFDDDC